MLCNKFPQIWRHKTTHTYYLTVSVDQQSTHNQLDPLQSRGSARAGFSSGGSTEEGSTSRVTEVVIRIYFLAAVRLRAQASQWLFSDGHLQLLESALGSLSHGDLFLQSQEERESLAGQSLT